MIVVADASVLAAAAGGRRWRRSGRCRCGRRRSPAGRHGPGRPSPVRRWQPRRWDRRPHRVARLHCGGPTPLIPADLLHVVRAAVCPSMVASGGRAEAATAERLSRSPNGSSGRLPDGAKSPQHRRPPRNRDGVRSQGSSRATGPQLGASRAALPRRSLLAARDLPAAGGGARREVLCQEPAPVVRPQYPR